MKSKMRLACISLSMVAAWTLMACGGGGGSSDGQGQSPIANPAPENLPGRLSAANVFYTGHSLMDDPFASDTQRIAESLSASHRWNQQITLGSPLRARTRGDNAEGSGFPGYQVGKNRDSFDMNVIAELRSPQTIGGQRYDTLVLTERHDIGSTLQWEDTVRYARHFFDRALEGNGQTRAYLYHSWLGIRNRSNPSEWITYEREAAPVWQCVAGRINTSLAAEGRSQRIHYMPAGLALTYLVEEAIQGRVAGMGSGVANAMQQLFVDDVHLSSIGSYFMSLVNFASIYRQSPQGAWAPASVNDTLKQSLQALAWQQVGSYYSNEANRSPGECLALMRDRFCGVFYNYISFPSATASCQAYFGRQDGTNPFFYNAATDRSYWFPAP